MTLKSPSRRVALLAWCVGICVAGCRQEQAAPPAPPPPVVTVTRPVTHPVQTYYEYNGNLEAVEMVEITARVMGFLDEIEFVEGEEVQEDDLLFKIDPREYVAAVKRAEANKRKAVAALRNAEMEEKRGKLLLETAAISEEDVQTRIVARETAEAEVMQTEAMVEAAELQLGYTEIRSPITGQISRTYVTRGNLVGQTGTTLLTTILSMDPLYVYFDAPERDLIEYQRELSGGEAPDWETRELPVEIGVATEDGYPHRGTIDFRENRVDPGTGTVRIRGRVPNPKVSRNGLSAGGTSATGAPGNSEPVDTTTPPGDAGSDAAEENSENSKPATSSGNARLLYPGLFARVRIPRGEPRPLVAIPEDALMTGQEGRFVYVLGDGNVVEKRTVKVGPLIWKATTPADAEEPTAWRISNSSQPESPAAKDPPPAAGAASAETPRVYSIVSIESGLTTDDQVLINGLTKARPGAPVAPELWELKPPVAVSGN